MSGEWHAEDLFFSDPGISMVHYKFAAEIDGDAKTLRSLLALNPPYGQ
jgi:hypothetical protein